MAKRHRVYNTYLQMVSFTPIETENWMLTPEGSQIADEGSHEAKVFNAIPPGETGLSISLLPVMVYFNF